MKKYTKLSKYMNSLRSWALIGTFSLMLISCFKEDTDDNSALYEQQFQQMKTAYQMDSTIGYDVYIKYITTGTDTVKATTENAVLISFEGYNYSGDLIGTTYATLAQEKGIFRADVIYGPSKFAVKYLVGGMVVGLTNMPVNSKATLIFPSGMAFGTGPVRYNVELHQIIKDVSAYEAQQRQAYMDTINFDNGSLHPAIDSTLWYKFIAGGDYEELSLDYSSTVTIELRANYCEFEPGVLESLPGRQFFKINNAKDTISYFFQNTTTSDNFPITPAVDSMVAIMNSAGYRQAEFITTSANTYGSTGYIHPYLGTYIVPPYMSVHYAIRLINIEN